MTPKHDDGGPADIEWLGHKQHFIGGDKCQFALAALVAGRWVVSTVGDYQPGATGVNEEIGFGRLFETYVFTATGEREQCGCPVLESLSEIDSKGYNDAVSATAGHMAMVRKYAEAARSRSTP